jgi:amidase
MASSNPLINQTAVEVVELLRLGLITPHDCLNALEARIAEVNGAVNALPTLCFERARKAADEIMSPPTSAGCWPACPWRSRT